MVIARLKQRGADYFFLVSFPFRRPFFFCANLLLETAVLLDRLILLLERLSLFLHKSGGYFLKLENARLEVVNKSA